MDELIAFVRSFFVQFATDIWNGLVAAVRPPMIWMTIGLAIFGADLMWIVATHG